MRTDITTDMQAVYLTGHGKNEVVRLGRRPTPIRKSGEVLIRMEASSLNHVDLYMRDSGAGITHTLPQTMGIEGYGRVCAVDEGSELSLGQRVILHPGITCGVCEFCQRGDDVLCTRMSLLGEHRDGTWAQWVSVPAANVLPAPDALNDETLAALGVAHLTAWRMLRTQANVKAGETLLIFGIGGGVSLAALQLGKAMGARCWVTSRNDRKLQRALEMGADVGFNSDTTDVSKQVMLLTHGRGVDVVFENVGQAMWSQAMKSLVRGGRLVTCGATSGDQPSADLRRLFIRQLHIMGSTLGNRQELQDLLQFMVSHKLSVHVEKTYSLIDIHQALENLSRGSQFGKLNLHIQDKAEAINLCSK